MLLALGAAGCGGPSKSAPKGFAGTLRPSQQPDELMPAGLDLVVRLDLDKLREVGHSPALDPLREPLSRRLHENGQASLLDLLKTRAKTVWLGVRGVPSSGRLDAVLVARGRFAAFDPSQGADEGQPSPWVRQPSTHPGRAVFERSGAQPRSAPSLLIVMGGEALVLATPLEAEGVRRILEQGPERATLTAPADGLLGLAVRPATLARAAAKDFPHLAGILSELATLEVVASIEPGGLRIDALITTASERGAERVQRVLKGWKETFAVEGDLVARLAAEGTSIERDGPTSLKARLRTAGETARKILTELFRGA